MKVVKCPSGIVIKDQLDFNIHHIFDCGQAFRFRKVGKSTYKGVAFGRILNIKQIGDEITLWPCTLDEFEDIWAHFFDLNTNYSDIKQALSRMDNALKRATDYGQGIRILRQDPWEMIISFIISANNNIPRIQNAIECLSQNFGHPIDSIEENRYSSFPTAEALSKASVEELRACGLGYRDKYVRQTAIEVATGQFDLEKMKHICRAELKNELITLPGIGAKVADCIMLFGFHNTSAFPVDTWVKKVMSRFYFTDEVSLKEMQAYAAKRYGELAGYAQQYLFYYAREGQME